MVHRVGVLVALLAAERVDLSPQQAPRLLDLVDELVLVGEVLEAHLEEKGLRDPDEPDERVVDPREAAVQVREADAEGRRCEGDPEAGLGVPRRGIGPSALRDVARVDDDRVHAELRRERLPRGLEPQPRSVAAALAVLERSRREPVGELGAEPIHENADIVGMDVVDAGRPDERFRVEADQPFAVRGDVADHAVEADDRDDVGLVLDEPRYHASLRGERLVGGDLGRDIRHGGEHVRIARPALDQLGVELHPGGAAVPSQHADRLQWVAPIPAPLDPFDARGDGLVDVVRVDERHRVRAGEILVLRADDRSERRVARDQPSVQPDRRDRGRDVDEHVPEEGIELRGIRRVDHLLLSDRIAGHLRHRALGSLAGLQRSVRSVDGQSRGVRLAGPER